jgi:AcrR family transcriptional regulator
VTVDEGGRAAADGRGRPDAARQGSGGARDSREGGGQGGPRRARLDPETRRAQLIDTALELLEERGLPALGVDDVADAAGVSRSLVYAYFGDRDGLAAEVYVRILGRLHEHLDIELPPDEAAIHRIVTDCMAFAEANRSAWRLLVSDPSRQHAVVRQARAERAIHISAQWHAATATPLPDSAPAGGRELPQKLAGAQLAAEAALGMLESGVLHWLDHPEVPAGEAAVLLTAILWSGLAGTA